jgi:hypothetical protein
MDCADRGIGQHDGYSPAADTAMFANEQCGRNKPVMFILGEKATASRDSAICKKNLFRTDTTDRLSDV